MITLILFYVSAYLISLGLYKGTADSPEAFLISMGVFIFIHVFARLVKADNNSSDTRIP